MTSTAGRIPGASTSSRRRAFNLVKAHGGEVRVETRSPEGGAAFTVVLPMAAAGVVKKVAARVA